MRKIPTLFIILILVYSISFAQNITCKITVNGCGKVKIGRSQKEIEKTLGKPDKVGFGSLKSSNDFFFTEFYSKGISVIYKTNTKTVQTILFYNNDSSEKDFAVFPNVETKTGIGWKSTPEVVIKIYGKPKEDFTGNDKNGSWRRIGYSKMDFRFENNILVRIGIFQKEKKEKVFSI